MISEGQMAMATQEERITALERATAEYRPILQNIAYELTMVKGLTIDQVSITQDLRRNMNDVKESLGTITTRLDRLETKFDEHTTLLTQILEHLSKK